MLALLLNMNDNPLSVRQRERVMSCVEFFFFFLEREGIRKENSNDVCHRTAEALEIRSALFTRVKAEMEAGEAAANAGARKHRGGPKPIEFDPFMRGCIRIEIHSFSLRKECQTMDTFFRHARKKLRTFQVSHIQTFGAY